MRQQKVLFLTGGLVGNIGISYIRMVFPSTLLRTSGLQNGSHQRPLNLSALMDKVGESRKEASAAAVRQQVKCSAPTALTAANMIAVTSSLRSRTVHTAILPFLWARQKRTGSGLAQQPGSKFGKSKIENSGTLRLLLGARGGFEPRALAPQCQSCTEGLTQVKLGWCCL